MILKREKSCGAIVYKMENGTQKILLVKHRCGGHWAFPKGHVEAGENEHQTAHREILEETGILVEFKGNFRESIEYSPKPNVLKEVVYFLGEAVDGNEQRQEEEISEIRWMTIEEARRQVTHADSRQLLDHAKKTLIGL